MINIVYQRASSKYKVKVVVDMYVLLRVYRNVILNLIYITDSRGFLKKTFESLLHLIYIMMYKVWSSKLKGKTCSKRVLVTVHL